VTDVTVQARDLRQSKRRRVLMRATIITVDGAQSARVRELTDAEAVVVSNSPLAEGSDIIFNRSNLLVAARVVWVNGIEAGLEFYRPVPIEELMGGMTSPSQQSSHDRLFFQS
jgi:hypothetical protein